MLFAECKLSAKQFAEMMNEKSAEGIVRKCSFTEGLNKLNQSSCDDNSSKMEL
jgi:hypothetical protein